MGKIGAAYGLQGWVKVFSFADPTENILTYKYFMISTGTSVDKIEITKSRGQGKGFVAHIKGCNDRDQTRYYTGKELLVAKSSLPDLTEEGYYWHQLTGLTVLNQHNDDLGKVDHLIETGANDVLVVKPSSSSVDDVERLIPYIFEQVVTKVDLEQGIILVDWERDYLQD